MGQEDEDILALLAINVDENYECLWSKYFGQLLASALRWTRNQEDANDVVQEAFLRAYRCLKGYPVQRVLSLKIRSWLYTITWHIYLNHATRYKPPLSESLDASEGGPFQEIQNDWRDQPEIIVENAETRHEIETAMARLPEYCSALLGFYYLDEFSYQEIANVLQQQVGTIRVRVHRCTSKLRQLLEKWESEAS